MEITVLASGSKGNCTLVRGEGGALLVDCGLAATRGPLPALDRRVR